MSSGLQLDEKQKLLLKPPPSSLAPPRPEKRRKRKRNKRNSEVTNEESDCVFSCILREKIRLHRKPLLKRNARINDVRMSELSRIAVNKRERRTRRVESRHFTQGRVPLAPMKCALFPNRGVGSIYPTEDVLGVRGCVVPFAVSASSN